MIYAPKQLWKIGKKKVIFNFQTLNILSLNIILPNIRNSKWTIFQPKVTLIWSCCGLQPQEVLMTEKAR